MSFTELGIQSIIFGARTDIACKANIDPALVTMDALAVEIEGAFAVGPIYYGGDVLSNMYDLGTLLQLACSSNPFSHSRMLTPNTGAASLFVEAGLTLPPNRRALHKQALRHLQAATTPSSTLLVFISAVQPNASAADALIAALNSPSNAHGLAVMNDLPTYTLMAAIYTPLGLNLTSNNPVPTVGLAYAPVAGNSSTAWVSAAATVIVAPPNSGGGGGSSSNTGLIVGLVVGIIGGLLVIILAVFLVQRDRERRKREAARKAMAGPRSPVDSADSSARSKDGGSFTIVNPRASVRLSQRVAAAAVAAPMAAAPAAGADVAAAAAAGSSNATADPLQPAPPGEVKRLSAGPLPARRD